MDFFIDRGGTFTDCLCLDAGQLRVAKVLSSDRAPLEGIRQLLGIGPDAPIPPCRVRMGTTLATNALLERTGQRFALLITRGFRDLLEIGTQAPPDLFALAIRKPGVLYDSVLEIDARADRDGAPIVRPDRTALLGELRALRALRAAGTDNAAVVVLGDHRTGALEREIAELAREAGISEISLSHELAPRLGLLARGDTASVDAYLSPRNGGALRFFSATRGHHADVGGITPGSMPAFSRSLAEEGAVFSAVSVMRGGTLDRELILQILAQGPYPARRPEENLADLQAQISAAQAGARLLLELARAQGLGKVER